MKTLSIDLDGVLNTYCGNYNEFEISPPREGAYEFLQKLSQNYKLEIFTVREKNLVQKWLTENGLNEFIQNITNLKNPYASIIIDDRALKFNGDFNQTLEEIKEFKPHWE